MIYKNKHLARQDMIYKIYKKTYIYWDGPKMIKGVSCETASFSRCCENTTERRYSEYECLWLKMRFSGRSDDLREKNSISYSRFIVGIITHTDAGGLLQLFHGQEAQFDRQMDGKQTTHTGHRLNEKNPNVSPMVSK